MKNLTLWQAEKKHADPAEVERRVQQIAAALPNCGGHEIKSENGAISWRLLPLERADRPRCGATCKGTRRPCRMAVELKSNGQLAARCRLHGGASTGPRTAKGRAAIAAANRSRVGTRYRAKGLPPAIHPAAFAVADAAIDATVNQLRARVQSPPLELAPMPPDVAAQVRAMAQRELDRRAQLERDANGGQ